MSTALAILKMARERLADPAHWTQGTASNEKGQYCVLGAICCGISFSSADSPTDYFRRAIDSESIIFWNDSSSRTHAEVLAAFDRAIALAETSPS